MSEATTPSAVPNPIATIVAAPIQAKPRADELLGQARGYPSELRDSRMAGDVTQLVKMLRVARMKLEQERTLISGPINQGLKQLKARFDAVTQPMEKAEKWLGDKLTVFQVEQNRLAREAEAAARKQQEEEALAAAVKLEEAGDTEEAEEVLEYASDAPAPIVAEEKIIRGDYGAATSLRTTWVHEIEDLAKVPAEFIMVNDRAVKDAIKAAEKGKNGKPILEIPGIKIIEVQKAVVR